MFKDIVTFGQNKSIGLSNNHVVAYHGTFGMKSELTWTLSFAELPLKLLRSLWITPGDWRLKFKSCRQQICTKLKLKYSYIMKLNFS